MINTFQTKNQKMGLFGGLFFSMFVQMVVVRCVQFLFVVGLVILVVAIIVIVLTHFTGLQIVLFLGSFFLGAWFVKWCRPHWPACTFTHRTCDVEEEVLYENPFVRKAHVY